MTWFLRSVLFCRTGVPYAYNGPADRHVCYTMTLRTDTKIDTASDITNKMDRTGQGSSGASYFVVQVCCAMTGGSTLNT